MNDDPFWGAAQVYGGQEPRALTNLRRQGFESFFPSFLARLSPRRDAEAVPLFPGYTFVLLVPDQQWSSINSTFGVIRLLTYRDGRPQRVSPDFIQSVRRCLVPDPDGRDVIDQGSRVRIASGPFRDHEAVVTWTREDRLGLFFQLFNRDVRMELSRSEVSVVA